MMIPDSSFFLSFSHLHILLCGDRLPYGDPRDQSYALLGNPY